MKRINLIALSLLPFFSTAMAADTVFCVNCSNEVMDIARQAQNLAQYTQQTSNLISQLEVLRRQAATLSGSAPTSQTNALLSNLMSVVNQGQALGYNLQNIEKKFQSEYPGYGQHEVNYHESYAKWSETTSASIRAALRAAGLQMENFSNEAATAETLKAMSQSARGQMQAIQVGNAVSSEMLDEMRRLRQIQVSQNQAQNAYLLGGQQQVDQKQYGLKKVLDQKNSVVQPYTPSRKVNE